MVEYTQPGSEGSSEAVAVMAKEDPMIGRVLHGTIKIIRLLGVGGMGSVYEGYQEHLQRKVAVKVMSPEHARNPIAAEYFIREARSASRIRHPNIIQILDFGKEDEHTLFLAMEFVPGQTLSDLLEKQFPLQPERTISILDQTLSALNEAHANNLVHRDMKPDNIMVERRRDDSEFVKVLDFGIAQVKGPDEQHGPLTQQGALVGTPHYMSPEQARGEQVDLRSDLFSLGTILYEMLTNKRPFGGSHVPEILMSVIKDDPKPPSVRRSKIEIDPALEAVCIRAMKKNPDLRYQTATEFRKAIHARDQAVQPQQQASPAHFIFKRKGEERSQRPATMALDAATASDAAAGVRVSNDVLDNIREPSQSPAVHTPAPSLSTGSKHGLNLDALRENLVGERRYITAVVIHQRTYSRIDPEDMATLRSECGRVVAEVAQKWTGLLHGRQGSFTTLLFGLPKMKTDDVFRAAQAAQELRAALRRISAEMEFGFALSSGEVFCAQGDVSRADGPPIDEASELVRGAADWDIVLAAGELQDQLSTTFRLGPPQDQLERSLLGILDVEQPRGETSEIVGRDAEIATVLGVLGRASRGKGAVMVLVGEPGMGKSALLAESNKLAAQRGYLVLRAVHKLSSYEGLRDVLVQWLVDLAKSYEKSVDDLPALFSALGFAPEFGRVLCGLVSNDLQGTFHNVGTARDVSSGKDSWTSIVAALREFVRLASQSRAVCLEIDQVAEVDAALADFIQSWTEFVVAEKALVKIAIQGAPSRVTALLAEGLELVPVNPLDEPSSRALLVSALPKRFPQPLVERFLTMAGGNPLHLGELIRYAKSQKDVSLESAKDWLTSAHDVAQILRVRLFGETQDMQNLLALLAVLGDGVDSQAIFDLAPSKWRTEHMLDQLFRQQMVRVDETQTGQSVFLVPTIFSSVISSQLSKAIRKRIHERAAVYYRDRVRASERPERRDLLALVIHLKEGEQLDQALKILDVLIQTSLLGFEFLAARGHIEHGISIAEMLQGDQVELLAQYRLKLARVSVVSGDMQGGLDLVRELHRAKGLSDELRCEIELELGTLWLVEEDPNLVEKIVRKALQEIRRLQSRDPTDLLRSCLLIRALQLMASVREKQGRLAQSAETLIEAIDLTERHHIPAKNNPWGPALLWEPLNQLGRIRLRMGELGDTAKFFEIALKISGESNDLRGELAARANLSALWARSGKVDDAYSVLQEALAVARQVSDLHSLAKLQHNHGLLLIQQDRLELARDAFESSLVISTDLDWREGIAMNASQIDGLSRKQGMRRGPAR
jgi:serine/threonine protein kinase/tetratricopeptide (TPR) repeat protein